MDWKVSFHEDGDLVVEGVLSFGELRDICRRHGNLDMFRDRWDGAVMSALDIEGNEEDGQFVQDPDSDWYFIYKNHLYATHDVFTGFTEWAMGKPVYFYRVPADHMSVSEEECIADLLGYDLEDIQLSDEEVLTGLRETLNEGLDFEDELFLNDNEIVEGLRWFINFDGEDQDDYEDGDEITFQRLSRKTWGQYLIDPDRDHDDR